MKDSFLRDLLFFVRKNKIISFSLLAFLVSFIFFAFMSVWIFFQNKTVITYTKTGYSTSGTLQLDIKMEIPFKSEGVKNCWQEGNGTWGSQYDIYIYNNSKYPFLDWELSMTVPEEARIDSSWNAEYVPTPGKISITGLDQFFTTEIHPKNSIKLGFVLYTNELMQKSDFILIGRFVRNPLKEASCITALVCLAVSLIVLIVSLFFYRTIKIQSAIDDEKIDSLLKLCARFIDTRDEYTKIHSSHVGFYSKEIAKEMGFDEEFQKNIYYMGMMHDVGKVLIPKEILCKPGKLSDEEWAEMKKHTSYGAEILSDFAAVKGIREA
ncbi:MAG: HD domain-containing protein, partial [Treponema sp.]|nr:HD domain-containing protein [Treponema sp.]MBR0032973.1 HD domain-containing protein [Treponema sp.]